MSFKDLITDKGLYMKEDKITHWIPTGSTLMDLQIGGGVGVDCGMGYPGGTFVNVVGDSSAGKTAFAIETIAAGVHGQEKLQEIYPQLARFRFHFDSAEVGNTFNTKKMYNFDINSDPFHLVEKGEKTKPRSKKVERLLFNISRFLDSFEPGDYGIYVLDSLDGIINDEIEKRQEERLKAYEAGKEFKEGSYDMRTQKFLSGELFPGLADRIKEKNCNVIIISQVRDKINAMFDKQTRRGGRALEFFCSVTIWLNHVTNIKRKERPIGIITKVKAKKTRHPRPGRIVTVSFLHSYGLDDVGDCVDFLYDLRGERGDLLAKSKAINLGEEPTTTNLKQFLEEKELVEDCKAHIKRLTGKTVMTKELIKGFFQKAKYKKLYESRFAANITREDLIQKIIAENRQEEFRQKVIEKWETIEKSILPERGGSKYG